ncbi:family 1 encapsulin nanocompartment shell protein [Bradyrhizobium sp. Ai1a-2]|uniref:family 1 encapsulin nanocompartment shell protein n=1 Tax=Bradyrhizobium sp. Ai1a-2 TaxID=196490 RepID=UPI0003F96B6E|nr:family 1 encapsulin nanocompartment shell protein [Bradyrhizobium sp. Ai1a-2]
MNNLHRELAPISDKAWAQIEEEASRTLKRHLAARRVVDVPDPKGVDLAAVGTGHVHQIPAPGDGIQAVQRDAKTLVELRVPFELSRQQIDDVERGATDSDWSPVKEAARKIAFAEDRAVFDGYPAAGIQGIRQGSSNAVVALPASVRGYPGAVAQAVSRLRLAGCNGPYALVLGADAYTVAAGGTDEGYPIFHHIERVIDGGMIWAPAVEGAFLLTTRGGDFELDIGQDISIGYLSHSSSMVELYFQETFTFRVLTTEASVVLEPSKAPAAKS